jgi:hypothetical protein
MLKYWPWYLALNKKKMRPIHINSKLSSTTLPLFKMTTTNKGTLMAINLAKTVGQELSQPQTRSPATPIVQHTC